MSQQQNEKNVAWATLGARLSHAREAANMGMRELSRQSNVDVGYISKIERGVNSNLSYEMAQRLAIALGISVDWLLHETGIMQQPQQDKVDPADCLQCAAKDKEIEWLREQLSKALDALAAKPSAAAARACAADDGARKERRGA